MLNSGVPLLKPSRIPHPASPSRPLHPPGYISEGITALSNGTIQPITTSTQGAIPPVTTPTHPSQQTSLTPVVDNYNRDKVTSEHKGQRRKQLTMVLHGINNPTDEPKQGKKLLATKLRPEGKQDPLPVTQRRGKKGTRNRGEVMRASGVPRTQPVRAGKVRGNHPTRVCGWSKGGRLNELRIRCCLLDAHFIGVDLWYMYHCTYRVVAISRSNTYV